MYLEIVTPEAILFSSEIVSVSVPGMDGQFQLLDNHAAIVSTLKDGEIKIESPQAKLDELYADKFTKTKDGQFLYAINSGTLELNNNKVIILAD
ncbi:MAG: hypothetical protein CMB99_10965 [Flavobacteriaceae bacterium]|nr:hypothetical protein [Flavobacteriaceae bacterium]|tara:strand:- start:129969 stop:130250 length:282 start_codon:yes stop_codon:yes gene_type:complete